MQTLTINPLYSTPPKALALIQARTGSTRLPFKTLLSLNGAPIIDWVIERTSRSRLLDSLLVAMPDSEENAPLFKHLEHKGVLVFQGDEQDVLGRFVAAAAFAGATCGTQENNGRDGTLIIRICADNPLIWGLEIDALINHFKTTNCDYAYNHIPRNNRYPDGLGAEILTYRLLRELDSIATKPEHREHCLSYIWDTKDRFTISTFDPISEELCRPDVKLDIDTKEDFCKLSMMPITINTAPCDVIAWYPKL